MHEFKFIDVFFKDGNLQGKFGQSRLIVFINGKFIQLKRICTLMSGIFPFVNNCFEGFYFFKRFLRSGIVIPEGVFCCVKFE